MNEPEAPQDSDPSDDLPPTLPVPGRTSGDLHGLDPKDLIAGGLEPQTVKPAWQPPAPEELSRLLPQYEIDAFLGRGGMGAVYRGRQVTLDRRVAIKLLPAELTSDAEFVARFEREARTLAKLHHPGIVLVHDFGQTSEGHLYFVMEFVDGTDLHKIIHGPGLECGQALEIITQICDALQYAHGQGVVHRDIKPANVIVSLDGRAKLADFGLARPLEDGSGAFTRSNVVMGTPDYMAPEALAGEADHRADLYSLGVMLYEMLTGRAPRGAWAPPSQRVQVDVRLDEVVIRALQEDRELRYQQASEIKTDVEAIRTTPLPKAGKGKVKVKSRAEAPSQRAGTEPKGKKTGSRVAVAIVFLIVVFGTWFYLLHRERNDAGAPAKIPERDLAKVTAPSIQWRKAGWTEEDLRNKTLVADGQWVRLGKDAGALDNMWRLRDGTDPITLRDGVVRLRYKWQGKPVTLKIRKDRTFGLINLHATTFGLGLYGSTAPEWSKPIQTHVFSAPLKLGDEGILELAALGPRLYARLNGKVVLSSTEIPDLLSSGGCEIQSENGTFRDIEYAILDGIADPLMALGWEAAGPASATKDEPFVNSLGMKFVPVPITGGPTDGQRVLFSIWETRVRDYEAFVEESGHSWSQQSDLEQGPDHAVVCVNWDDAQAFCTWLTERERNAGRLSAGEIYRLPSDHEWSCAVGIGDLEDAAKLPQEKNQKLAGVFPWGNEWPPVSMNGNYSSEELRPMLAEGKYGYVEGEVPGYRDGQTTVGQVGRYTANGLGLFDLGGNVWEWCEDWYDIAQRDRVLRGASWHNHDRGDLLSSHRWAMSPDNRGFSQGGFRCVLALEAPKFAIPVTPVPQKPSGSEVESAAHGAELPWRDFLAELADASHKNAQLGQVWTREGSGWRVGNYHLFTLPDDAGRDLAIRMTATIAPGGGSSGPSSIVISVRSKEGSSYFGRLFNTGSSRIEGVGTVLKGFMPIPDFDPASSHTLELLTRGDLITLLVDGIERGSVRDSSLSAGGFFGAGAAAGSLIEKVEYRFLDSK